MKLNFDRRNAPAMLVMMTGSLALAACGSDGSDASASANQKAATASSTPVALSALQSSNARKTAGPSAASMTSTSSNAAAAVATRTSTTPVTVTSTTVASTTATSAANTSSAAASTSGSSTSTTTTATSGAPHAIATPIPTLGSLPTPSPTPVPVQKPTPTPTPIPTPIATPTPTPVPTSVPVTLAFAAGDYSIPQSAKQATLSVARSGATDSAVTVQYTTADGSGVAGKLYTSTSGTLQWAANDTSAKTISVPVSTSLTFSGKESFRVSLSNPSADATLASQASATVTVTGDVTPASLQFASASYTVAENAGSLTVTVARSGDASAAATVAYATANGSAVAGTNYTATNGTLSWAANDTSNKTFSVSIKNAASMTASATFQVSLSSPSAGATLGSTANASVSVTPVAQSTSGDNAAKVLSFLNGLKNQTGPRVLSGQHADIWNASSSSTTEPMDVVTPLVGETGVNPAILGLVLNYATNSYAYDVAVTNTLANQWWSKGGLVMISLYSNDPTFSFNSSGAPTGQSIPSSAFHSLTDHSSAAYKQWHAQLDTYSAALHTLTDSGNVVLLRPFIEINGNWNWYGAENASDFIAVWQDMHDYMMNTKGLKNVLWIYNVNDNVGHYGDYYPGSSYVDVVGMDVYDDGSKIAADANSGGMYQTLVATGKPLIFPEIGLSTNMGIADDSVDNTAIIKDIKASLPNVVGFLVWNQVAICRESNASALLNDPMVINLSNMPSGL